MLSRTVLVLAVALAVSISAAPAITGATSHYDVSFSSSTAIDTPDRSQTFQGKNYTVTQLERVEAGQSFDVSVTVGSDTDFDVHLYNADQEIENTRSGTGDGSVTFPTSALDAGSYVAALEVDGVIEDVEPVVVTQYQVSVDAPDETTEGSTIEVEAELTEVESGNDLEQVTVVIGNGGENFRQVLAHQSGSTYGGTVDVGSLPTGSYSLYVVAQGNEEIYAGQNEILGASDEQAFKVVSEPDDDNDESGSSSNDGGNDGSDESDGTKTTTSPTTTESTTDSTADPTASSDTTPPPETTNAPETTEDVPETTTTDDSVITPNAQTTAPPTTTSPGQPLGVLPVLVALLLLLVLAGWRR